VLSGLTQHMSWANPEKKNVEKVASA